MKKQLCFNLLFGLITFGMSFSLSAQIRHTVRFDRSSLEEEAKLGEDGVLYSIIRYPQCIIEGEEGKPALPYKYLQFIVPTGNASYNVKLVSTVDQKIALSNKMWPAQSPHKLSIYNSPFSFVWPEPSIYYSTEPYPLKAAEIVSDGYFDGDKRIITVRICPIQYYPQPRNEIIFNTTMNLLIQEDITQSEVKNPHQPIHSVVLKSDEELMDELSFVDNKNDILTCVKQVDHANSSGISLSMPTYEYIIIAPEAFASALQRLVFWKNMKGMTAGVVTLESILNNPQIKGDEVSRIYDDAGKIRHYLTYAYQHGAKYVFLVGKDVPFRYGYAGGKIPSDLYYSDLNGNWHSGVDKEYGSLNDKIDGLPELYVGRITCKNIVELNNYLYKLICYEKNPGCGNGQYLTNAFYTQADASQASYSGSYFAVEMSKYVPNPVVFGELPRYDDPDPYFPTGKNVVDEMNKHYGFIGFYNHGWDFGIAVATKKNNELSKYGLTFSDVYYKEEDHFANETGNGVDCLTNVGYPCVVYSLSCYTMPYDKSSDIPYNFGEAFTIMGKYGAVAYLGYTRESYFSEVDMHFAMELRKSDNRVGVAMANSKAKLGKICWDVQLANNLFGCPEFKMWTNIPRSLNVEIENQNNQILVTSDEKKVYISMVGLFKNESYRNQQYLTSSSVVFENVPNNYLIVANKNNYRPYVAPLYLQNENIIGKYKLFDLNKVFLGNRVDNKKIYGDFILEDESELYIEYSDEVILDSGFEVKKGAIFELDITER